jgi:hypothetical protein
MKLREFLNLTQNRKNKQLSLNVRKTKLKENNLDIEDILELNLIKKKLKKFEDGDDK